METRLSDAAPSAQALEARETFRSNYLELVPFALDLERLAGVDDTIQRLVDTLP
jgi:hypothetical protein